MTILLVSHSPNLAAATKTYLHEMIPKSKKLDILVAAGAFDDSIGTDINKITEALKQSLHKEVLIICDFGSAVLSAKLASNSIDNKTVYILNGSFLEGAFVAANLASSGVSFDLIKNSAEEIVKKY